MNLSHELRRKVLLSAFALLASVPLIGQTERKKADQLPVIGAPVDSAHARHTDEHCAIHSSQIDPCFERSFGGIQFTVAFSEQTKEVSYIETRDKRFRTTDGLTVGTEIDVSSKTVMAYPGWLVFAPPSADGWWPIIGFNAVQLKEGTELKLWDSTQGINTGTAYIQGFAKSRYLTARTGPPLDATIAHFDVTDAVMREAVGRMSREKIENLHVGYEEVLLEKLGDDSRIVGPHFSLHLENYTVRQILDTLCSADMRYTWSVDGATINVYPRTRREGILTDLRIEHIEFKDVPDPNQALTPLAKLFPNVQIGYFGSGLASSTYQLPWSASFEHLTVRQFINRLAEHMGPHTSWVWGGGKNEAGFTFLKGGFHAAYESTAAEEDGH